MTRSPNDGAELISEIGPRGRREIQPHLLVFDPRADSATGLVQELRASGARLDVTIVDLDPKPRLPARDWVEVAAINLDGAATEGLVFAAELSVRVPSAEFVFWLDGDQPSPGEEAARSLGLQRIMPRAQLVHWLGQALEPLARIARAKREQAAAEAVLPRVPAMAERSSRTMPLPEAERSFRESYLRGLLAQASNARIAAQQAGVPYTTLCSMLKKMGMEKAVRPKSK